MFSWLPGELIKKKYIYEDEKENETNGRQTCIIVVIIKLEQLLKVRSCISRLLFIPTTNELLMISIGLDLESNKVN